MWKKLKYKYIWKRIFYERLTEPIHLNLLSVGVGIFGSYRQKIAFDLVLRPHHAYSLLKTADRAKSAGIDVVSVIEFGVGMGAGLNNIEEIAKKVTQKTGVSFKIYGFDSGKGMPAARDYRDHPDLYQQGDFAMDIDLVKQSLGENTQLIIGELSEKVGDFIGKLPVQEPIGFVSIDVDYYHSTKEALKVFEGKAAQYLPITIVYVDDIALEPHNSYCGELLALREFNDEHKYRKIEHHRFFENSRIFKKADWIKHIYQLHVLDHPLRCQVRQSDQKKTIENPYL